MVVPAIAMIMMMPVIMPAAAIVLVIVLVRLRLFRRAFRRIVFQFLRELGFQDLAQRQARNNQSNSHRDQET